MAGIAAPAFNGVMNTNEIYNALYNVNILFLQLVPQTVDRDEIISLVEKSVGLFGDTGLRIGADIQGTYDFLGDAEASNLLAINRNESEKVERYVIDKWRQTDITVDAYLSKRAFLGMSSFAEFNGYLVGTLAKAMDAFENGYVKSSIGTFRAAPASMNIDIYMPAADGTEATERIRAAAIKKAILDLKVKIRDNSRDFNGYGFYASYNWKDFTPVFSSEYSNEINALALYSTFNPKFIEEATDGHIWTPKWFGNVDTIGGTTSSPNTTVYSLIEQNSDGTTNLVLTAAQKLAGVYRIFPGDLLPASFTYNANEAYIVDTKVIAKIFAPEHIVYMTGYQQGEAFHNSRSGTDNHYYRKGFSPVYVSKFRPFFTLRETNTP